jgi:hypothetical protein
MCLCDYCGITFPRRPSNASRYRHSYCSRHCSDLGRREPLAARFWRHVEQTSGCWLWTGRTNRQGYGKTWSTGKPVRTLIAHRVSWELHHGPIPPGAFVLHDCDTPACVNPAHLSLGDHAQNMADKVRRHRQKCGPELVAHRKHARGERHGWAKLTDDSVREIRALWATGQWSQQRLGERFHVDQTCISSVVRRQWWTHVI